MHHSGRRLLVLLLEVTGWPSTGRLAGRAHSSRTASGLTDQAGALNATQVQADSEGTPS
jgi:hypothetical protein